MTRLRRVSPTALAALAVVLGVAAVLAGVFLLLGVEAALILGGVALVAAGLGVDVG